MSSLAKACMRDLDEVRLTSALGAWLDRAFIRALLTRRDHMARQIEELVATRGKERVFIH